MGVRTSAGVGLLGAIPDCRDSAATLQCGGGDGKRAVPTGRTQFRSLPVAPFGEGPGSSDARATRCGAPHSSRPPARSSRPDAGLRGSSLLSPSSPRDASFLSLSPLPCLLPICCSLVAFSQCVVLLLPSLVVVPWWTLPPSLWSFPVFLPLFGSLISQK